MPKISILCVWIFTNLYYSHISQWPMSYQLKLPDGTKPLPELVLTSHQQGIVAFIREKKSYPYLLCVCKLPIHYYSYISQQPTSYQLLILLNILQQTKLWDMFSRYLYSWRSEERVQWPHAVSTQWAHMGVCLFHQQHGQGCLSYWTYIICQTKNLWM